MGYSIANGNRNIVAMISAALAIAALAGCGPSDKAATAPKTITVFAAASTSRVMEEIAAQFEKEYGIIVETNFAS